MSSLTASLLSIDANLYAALLVLIISAVIYWAKPRIFARHGYLRRAFQMWIGQWFAFMAIFVVLAIVRKVSPDFGEQQWHLVVLLSFVDVQTVFALGCGWILVQGNRYSTSKVMSGIGIVLLCLLFWNVGVGLLFITSDRSREMWIFPSRMFAMLGFLLISLALIRRSKLIAVPFLVITMAYAAAQLPVYFSLFVATDPVQNWFIALAVGKLLLALTFYPAFFLVKVHKPITFEDVISSSPRLAGYVNETEGRLPKYLISALLSVLTLAVTELIRQGVVKLVRGGK